MTVSLRRMSAGSGYRYLLRSVAAGDGNRALSTPLTRYYSEVGTPPGLWLGGGLSSLGDGQLEPGMEVTEAQLALLVGMGRDPISGDQLGRAYPVYKPLSERIKERVDAIDPEMTLEDCAAERTRIEAEETKAGLRHAVAGFDLTFSVPKSVSVLWGLADAETQERIVEAHHAAVADVIDFFEREIAATRAGVADRAGAVAQVDVAGVAAVAYDHYDSRAGDPQLHTHVVISNRVMTVLDGRWRSLDGRPIYSAMTGVSAHYNAVLADRLTRDLGVEWELRERGADRNPQWEINGISDDLVGEFSSRSREIDLAKDRLIAAFVQEQGRMPSATTIIELRAQATLATRPPKQIRSLADLTADWRTRAERKTGIEPSALVAVATATPALPLRADEVPLAAIEALGADVVAAVSLKRSTWTHWILMAEASKQSMDLRFATTQDREAVVAMIIDAAEQHSIRLTPPELAISPAAFRRPDETSVFRPKHSAKYSSRAVLEAEARLLDRAENTAAPRVDAATVDRIADRSQPRLGHQQQRALNQIATSGRQVDVLVGPAGAGKTTAMQALRAAWIVGHGDGSVLGLAPSAAAAQALADDLGVGCDNTAKWLHEFDHGRATLDSGQLVIIDEATLAATVALDRITGIAAAAGAKVLLVGDPHQLQAVDAGGAFALLVDRRPDPPELTELHRFTHGWEKDATLALREGKVEAISTYACYGRIREGDTDQMLDAAYAAWRGDTLAGRASILVAESADAVRALNERARAERIAFDGATGNREVVLADGTRASVGDIVITRRNDRTLQTNRGGWVKNGDRWHISEIRRNGAVVVSRLEQRGRGSAVLDPGYVHAHVDLGYAVTAYRAQGVTVDSSHVVVTASTTRENLYVSMSRGRDSNTAYVALDQPDDSHTTPETEDVTAQTVLFGVLQHTGDSLSAHQTIESEHEVYAGIDRLAAELETIAAAAQHDRLDELLKRSGLTYEQHAAVLASSAFGPLTAALRRAEANHHDLDQLLPRIVSQHSLVNADDVAAVLRQRLSTAANRPPRGCRTRPRLIAGLIPEPLGPMGDEDRHAIDERKQLIENRARALADQAIEASAPWVRRLGTTRVSGRRREEWIASLTTVGAYRDRYQITNDLPLGGGTTTDAQRADRQRALRAAREATTIATNAANAVRPSDRIQVPTMSAP